MSHNKAPLAKVSIMAEFPENYFLENLAVRKDNSVLVQVANKKELWYVPPAEGTTPVTPVRLHTYQENAAGIIELEPDVFLLLSGNVYTTHESYLHRLDLRNWQAGTPISPQLVCRLPERARGVKGFCLLAPGVALIADCFGSLIWRMDIPPGGGTPTFRVWLEHESMGYYPGKMKPEQPGVNGVRYAAKTQYLYYTATAKMLFMRVPVSPQTLEPAGAPELVVAGRMGDDFLLDEEAEVVYLTTHRQNTIDIVSMDPGLNSGFTQSVAGEPPAPELIGPSAGAWRRGPGDQGHVAIFITDGGTASPPPLRANPRKASAARPATSAERFPPISSGSALLEQGQEGQPKTYTRTRISRRPMSPVAKEMVVGDNVAIETYVQGEGTTLVVLPSYGRDGGADFDDFASRLAASGVRVLRPQPRGIGRSTGTMQASLQDMTNDVALVIQQLGGGRAVVLGHAFGNGVARLLATTQPNLVRGTILAAASTEGASKETNQLPFIAGDPSRPESERLDALQRGFFAPHRDARVWLDGWYPATLEMQKAAVEGAETTFFNKAGEAPVLQILAESDPFSPYASWRSLREECGHRVTARIVADASHALFPEQTPEVADLVKKWLFTLHEPNAK